MYMMTLPTCTLLPGEQTIRMQHMACFHVVTAKAAEVLRSSHFLDV